MNVKFYRLSSLPTFSSSTHTGIFVHLTTDQMSGDTVLHKAGLYFGGESSWEYLTNDTDVANIQSMIDNTIAGLDVTGYAQGSIAAVSGENPTSSELKIFGIKEVDGEISHNTTTDLTINVDGVYNASSNKIATQSTVTNALGTLNGSHNVVTISDYTPQTGENATKKIEFFDATQTNGAITTDSPASDTLYLSQAVNATNPIITKGDLSGIVGAMVYRDSITYSNSAWSFGSTTPTSPSQGDVYVVSTGFTLESATELLGTNVPAGTYEAGDTLIYTGSSWNVINGENQVSNAGATITVGAGSAATIATVDGTAITAQVNVTAGSATIASKSGNSITLNTGVTQGTNTGTITNTTGEGATITLADVAATGAANELTVTSGNYGGTTATTNAQTALNNLASAISSASITIDGHVGAITTGDGLTDVAADGGSFGIKIDSTNANGLSVGANGLAMAKATGSSFGTVEVTTGNGLTLTDGVVSYEHNTFDITVASESDGVVTINGTLTPNASDEITASNSITLAKVATTGAAADVSYAGTTDVTGSEPATVEAALDDLYIKVNTLQSTHTVVAGSNSVGVTSATSGNTTTYTVDLVWQETL